MELALIRLSNSTDDVSLFRAHMSDQDKSDEEVQREFGHSAQMLFDIAKEEVKKLEGASPDRFLNAIFIAGFVFGRSFEELQVIELDQMNNLTFTHKKRNTK